MLNVTPQSFITDFFHDPPFSLHAWQSAFIEDLRIPQFSIHGVVKGRQIGFSDLIIDYALWKSFRQSNHNTIIVTMNTGMRNHLAQRIYHRIDTFIARAAFDFIAHKCITNVTFKNGSRVKVIRSHPDAGCGEQANLLVFDEAAYIPDLKEMWVSMFPTVYPEGTVILASTPHGKNEFYHRIQELKSSNAFIVHTIPSDTVLTSTALARLRSVQSDGQFRAEHECEFI